MKNKLVVLKAKLGEFKGAVMAGAVMASTGAFAATTTGTASTGLSTALDTVTTSATSGISSIETHSATVIAAVFGVVLLFVGARHLFSATKAR